LPAFRFIAGSLGSGERKREAVEWTARCVNDGVDDPSGVGDRRAHCAEMGRTMNRSPSDPSTDRFVNGVAG
jgi:hypothetical protein